MNAIPLTIDDLSRADLLTLIRYREAQLQRVRADGFERIHIDFALLSERDIVHARWVGTHDLTAACAQQEQAAEDEYHRQLLAASLASAAFTVALQAGASMARLDRLERSLRAARRRSSDADEARQKIRRRLDRLHTRADALWGRMEELKK